MPEVEDIMDGCTDTRNVVADHLLPEDRSHPQSRQKDGMVTVNQIVKIVP
jgi:hypothetical protein